MLDFQINYNSFYVLFGSYLAFFALVFSVTHAIKLLSDMNK